MSPYMSSNIIPTCKMKWRTPVHNSKGYSHMFDIAIFVPDKKLATAGNITESAVENVFVMLECEQVLLLLMSRAANESHPAGGILVTTIKEISKFAFFVNLRKTKKSPFLLER